MSKKKAPVIIRCTTFRQGLRALLRAFLHVKETQQ